MGIRHLHRGCGRVLRVEILVVDARESLQGAFGVSDLLGGPDRLVGQRPRDVAVQGGNFAGKIVRGSGTSCWKEAAGDVLSREEAVQGVELGLKDKGGGQGADIGVEIGGL